MNTFTDEYKSFKGPHVVSKKTQAECPEQNHLVLMKKKMCHAQGKYFTR